MSTTRVTTCNRDCPDTCTIRVTVEDGRAVRLQGAPDDPVTRGFLCQRTHRFLDRQYASDRITQPLRRKGGRLEPVSWDEALGTAAEKLLRFREESGPASILHYRSGGSLGLLKLTADRLFEAFGPVSIKRGDICSGAGEAAQEADFGVAESHELEDLLNSRTIVLWGKNPFTSGPHLIPVLKEARARGARIVGLDPVRTRSASLCDHWYAPRAGSDYAVVMGVVRHLFERGLVDPRADEYCTGLEGFRALAFRETSAEWARRADLSSVDLEELALLYGEGSPAAILIGWGLARRRSGSRTVRALDGLAAISGNLGIAGGGASFYFARRAAFDTDIVQGAAVAPRTLSEPLLGRAILEASDPPVRAVWVTAGNPVSMLPDSDVVCEALRRTEFTVVVDTHPTDTTDVADLVLPTLTLLEDDDLLGAYGNHYLRVSRPAVTPPEGPRHELAIHQDLAARLGLGEVLAGSPREWKRRFMKRLEGAGVRLEDLEAGPVRSPFAAPVLFADRRFPTADGRVQLLQEAARAPEEDAAWPLRLLAASVPEAQSSQQSRPFRSERPEVRVHPGSAAGFGDGETARLESRQASMEVSVRHDDAVRPEVALMAKGGMLRDGRCANRLVTATLTDEGEGAAYYDEPVRLVPLA